MCGAGAGAQGRKGSLNFSRHVICADGGMSFGWGRGHPGRNVQEVRDFGVGSWVVDESTQS